MTARRLGVLGGTFDPIHLGHLDAAEAARAALGLDDILLVPSSDPPHRRGGPHASVFHRFALVALAIEGRRGYRVSDVELTRAGPSYTADTLRTLHASGWTSSQIFFMLGADAYADISTWREYPHVLDAAHFVVIARPGMTVEDAAARAPSLRSRMHPANAPLPADGTTRVIVVEARTPDISSTVIRARCAAGEPIDDLVPDAVARHIVNHQLYAGRRE